MYCSMLKIINAADSRYLNREEQEKVIAYINSMPKRLQAARQIEQKEDEIVEAVIQDMKRRWTNFANLHDSGWEKGIRDVQLVLRYNVQGMMLDDMDVAPEKLLYWLKTILSSAGMTPKFIREGFTMLKDNCKAKLSAEVFALLEPHLQQTVEILSDFPEPLAPAV